MLNFVDNFEGINHRYFNRKQYRIPVSSFDTQKTKSFFKSSESSVFTLWLPLVFFERAFGIWDFSLHFEVLKYFSPTTDDSCPKNPVKFLCLKFQIKISVCTWGSRSVYFYALIPVAMLNFVTAFFEWNEITWCTNCCLRIIEGF